MLWVVLSLYALIVTVVLVKVGIGRAALAEAASMKRLVDSRDLRKRALGMAETDRLIREQDHELLPDSDHKHLNCYICGPGPLLKGKVPSKFQHPLFREEERQYYHGYSTMLRQVLIPANTSTAEVVSSEVIQDGKYTGMHSIMLDVDLPVAVIESTHTGHHHLYIDRLVTWRQYKKLLRAMRDCGVIEKGYYNTSISRRATHLRPPWVTKPDKPASKTKKKRTGWRGRH